MNAPAIPASASAKLAEELEWRLATIVLQTLRGSFTELSRTATGTLAQLRDQDGCRVTELAAAQAVAQPTMTTLVRRLEGQGLVTRGADADDARAVRVAITDAGLALLDRARAARAQALEERLQGLTGRERTTLERALPVLNRLISIHEED